MNCLKPLLLSFALAATSALAAEGRGAATKAAGSIILKPQKIHEKCLSLSPPQKLQYSFGTDKAVDFDIHYHKGDMVYYPVREKENHVERRPLYPAVARRLLHDVGKPLAIRRSQARIQFQNHALAGIFSGCAGPNPVRLSIHFRKKIDMKQIWVGITVALLSAAFLSGPAEAARFGGGKSIGMQRNSVNRQAAPTPPTAAQAVPAKPATAAPSGMSRWLGPLAGLAAGGLLGAVHERRLRRTQVHGHRHADARGRRRVHCVSACCARVPLPRKPLRRAAWRCNPRGSAMSRLRSTIQHSAPRLPMRPRRRVTRRDSR